LRSLPAGIEGREELGPRGAGLVGREIEAPGHRWAPRIVAPRGGQDRRAALPVLAAQAEGKRVEHQDAGTASGGELRRDRGAEAVEIARREDMLAAHDGQAVGVALEALRLEAHGLAGLAQ
jgi:hypothetical protein